MDYGIKVSEPGFDVKSAGDKNLSLRSGLTLLKVYSQAQLTLSNSGFNDVSHSLSYLPQYLTFVKGTIGEVYLANGMFHGFTTPIAVAKMTTSKLSIYQTVGATQTAFYYIFYEPIDTGTDPGIVVTNYYGIKVSKDGVAVESANILQQTFNSEKNSLKIITDNTSTSTANGNRTVTIAHGLTFTPGFLIFFQVNSNGYWFPNGSIEDITGVQGTVIGNADATNLNIAIYTNVSATVKVHYYILADPGVNV
jgi:hypothetical protein